MAAGLPSTMWTVGHSTRAWEELLALLGGYGIEAVADVRRFPGSRRYPWFASEAMASGLPAAGIEYLWLPQLGGRRKVLPGSRNGGWRNASFQGYADHLDSAEFAEGLALLLELAGRRRTTMMCAEALWWRCHRALVSDVLKLRGIEVVHILAAGQVQVHRYSAAARVDDGRLGYPPMQDGLFGDG